MPMMGMGLQRRKDKVAMHHVTSAWTCALLAKVNLNFANVEEKIYQALKDAIAQLQQETKKKVSALLSVELELRRRLEQIEWSEG